MFSKNKIIGIALLIAVILSVESKAEETELFQRFYSSKLALQTEKGMLFSNNLGHQMKAEPDTSAIPKGWRRVTTSAYEFLHGVFTTPESVADGVISALVMAQLFSGEGTHSYSDCFTPGEQIIFVSASAIGGAFTGYLSHYIKQKNIDKEWDSPTRIFMKKVLTGLLAGVLWEIAMIHTFRRYSEDCMSGGDYATRDIGFFLLLQVGVGSHILTSILF